VVTEETKDKLRKSRTGSKLSADHKEKISMASKNKILVRDEFNNYSIVYLDDPRYLSGELISISKGRIWINNGVDSKMICKNEVDSFISDGWVIGRKYLKKVINDNNK